MLPYKVWRGWLGDAESSGCGLAAAGRLWAGGHGTIMGPQMSSRRQGLESSVSFSFSVLSLSRPGL